MDLERAMEFLLEQQATAQAQSHARMSRVEDNIEKLTASQLRADGEIRALRLDLRRAVRLSVLEARAERKRRKEEDAKLAMSQEELRQSLRAFIDSMKQPRNGHDQN